MIDATPPSSSLASKIFRLYIPVVVMLVAAAVYYRLVLVYNVNAPYSDDFGIALLFMNEYVDQQSFLGKLGAIFSQHGEHRLAFPHMVILLDYYLQGHVNFYVLGIIGNLGLVGMTILFYFSAGQSKDKLLFFCPVPLLIFQLQYWELIPFSTAVIQGFYVIFFAFLSLYLLEKESRAAIVFAFLAFFLAIFSSGSGMLVFLPGAVLLGALRKYKILAGWILVFLVSIAVYFNHYSSANASNISAVLQQPGGLVMRYLAAVGGFVNFVKGWEEPGFGYAASIFAGIVLTGLFLLFTYKKCYVSSPVVYGLLFFLFLCCATVAVSRFDLYTPSQLAAVSRYKIVSISLVCCSYLLLLDLLKSKLSALWSIPLLVVGVLYNWYAYKMNIDILVQLSDGTVETSWAIFEHNDYSQIRDWNPELSASTLKESEQKDVFKMPDLRDEYIRRTPLSEGTVEMSWEGVLPADTTIKYQFDVLASSDKGRYAIRKGWALKKGAATRRHLLVLQNEDTTFFLSTHMHWRMDITEAMNKDAAGEKVNYDGCGFNVAITPGQVADGEYEVGVILQSWDNSSYYIPANKKIVFSQ